MNTSIIVTGVNGRMGGTIARLVQEDPALELAGVVEKSDRIQGLSRFDCPSGSDLSDIISMAGKAVVIDFTTPAASLNAAETCAKTNTAAVIGTTGFSQNQIQQLEVIAKETSLFWAPNMSVGVNVLRRILPELINMLGDRYDIELMEIHHRFKKDAPSGTALMLARVLAESRGMSLEEHGTFARHGITGERNDMEIGVQTLRGGDVVGDHTVYLLGPGERIEVTHRAHSRETFAQGAIRAARWMSEQKPGRLYNMEDLLS